LRVQEGQGTQTQANRLMQQKLNESLEASLEKLAYLDKLHLELGKAMYEAYGGAIYGMDLLATAALNRSKAHIAGFRRLIESHNLLCAGAILRLQLDTALRFHAAFLVKKPHDFAVEILSGKKMKDMRDQEGKLLTDTYLVKKLGKEFEWVPRVYDRTSGYVHFSATHMMAALSVDKDDDDSTKMITGKISDTDKPLPEWIYIEACDAFCASTEILLKYIHGWVLTKANPDTVAKWRRDIFGE